MAKSKRDPKSPKAQSYKHPEAQNLLRPDVGTQAQFKKKKGPKTYRYDSSLSPALDWDGKNAAREVGEELIGKIISAKSLVEAKAAAAKLKALGKPFLNWAGKAERLSFDVPTLPLFVHERLSTAAILETLGGHRKGREQLLLDLFSDPQRPIAEQVLRAYEHKDKWVNRMVLGDSLVVMNSLLHYEGLGGQVQMIYMDPPYGVKFGSNFQPFVRKRDVGHNDDEDMTREPEMVQAYRDTWEMGLHSYLTYMRDRLLLARELLKPTGSVFVQISDENLHHVRELMDEIFGAENCCSVISFAKTGGATPRLLATISDYLLWYARDRDRTRYHQVFEPRPPIDNPYERYICVETADGQIIDLSVAQKLGRETIPSGRLLRLQQATSPGESADSQTPVTWNGRSYFPPKGRHWSVTAAGMQRVVSKGRAHGVGNTLTWKQYRDEFPFRSINNNWVEGISATGFGIEKLYVVQTIPEVMQRCLLTTTEPGDLVLDPTCGSGTTAYVAEQWGRRWITIDTSRVPLALARQRLLTATYPWYELQCEERGPAGGFVYGRKRNTKGEEVGGIVPHVTLKSIANDEPPAEEVLVDRPEEKSGITRITGPFCVEATMPTPVDWEGDGVEDSGAIGTQEFGSFVDRMLEVLRKSPVLRLEGNRTVSFKNVRPPAKSLTLTAEALVANGADKAVAFVFGPENGAVSEKLVYEAAREAHAKAYTHLYVIGFAIQPNARLLVDTSAEVVGVPATYVQATPDLLMGDLLKNMRSSQIFSVCGSPEVKLHSKIAKGTKSHQVELLGLDVFDPVTMETAHRSGADVPAWFLDTDYNGLCFHVCQAFFPRTAAWDNIRKALKVDYDDSVWDHLAGAMSAPFDAGEHGQVAVKVIDDRGNELLVVKTLTEGKK